MVPPPIIACPACHHRVPIDPAGAPPARCPTCGQELLVDIYPALFRPPETLAIGQLALAEGEASCFYHSQKKAAVACEACGRFLCALCDVEFRGQHLCPACIQTGRTKRKDKHLENRRVMYDDIALTLAVLPPLSLIGLYFTWATAPLALFVTVRYWNAPRSVLPRTKARFILAALLAAAQVIAWGALIVALFNSIG